MPGGARVNYAEVLDLDVMVVIEKVPCCGETGKASTYNGYAYFVSALVIVLWV